MKTDAWADLRGPLSFALGAVILLTELGWWVLHGALVEPELLVVGAGLVGVPAFLPSKNGK